MTDRIKSFTVYLEQPIKDEDIYIKPTLNAIRQIKGVSKVIKVVRTAEDYLEYERGYNDALDQIRKMLCDGFSFKDEVYKGKNQ